ncbi:type IV pilus assembly protein PilM [Neptuniibacter sp. CAU 1671]|uniref:type IV pilus assembly protein PilM n=1 Tax=Neptuniibacter sp. CAU 1671 TaxID=3032593 RepID=UPI0023DB3228|nr:type IV pilus assembly protein PilM [Neptuniibacter sp. CAU 1671]MDF2181654.1 type IV pilus assembly protein PilM [Neptuniibacter sp. CAU 1671]
MFGFMEKKSGEFVGIDIGASSIKLVALSKQGKGYSLQAYAVVSLPGGAINDGNIQNPEVVSEAISKALRISGSKAVEAITAVPSSAVITKTLQMNALYTERDLEEQVRLEADQFIPYPLDEVALDFEMQGPSSLPNLNQILVVACRKDDVEQREDVVTEGGLKCLVVDVDTFTLERAVNHMIPGRQDEDPLVGVVDIGASTLTLHVLRGDKIVYTREQAFGGNELTNSIHQQYGMSAEEVEQALRSGELSQEITEMLVLPFRATVVQQVSRALQFFYSSGAHSELSRLLLAGGVANIEGLAGIIEEEVGVPSVVANPFSDMAINSKVNRVRLERDASALLKALGMAIRGFEE